MTQSLDLFPIGNCAASALIDREGRYVWACAPRVDGDPVFSALLGGDAPEQGFWSVEVEDLASVRQTYLRNTPVLCTELTDKSGGVAQVIDFAPRYRQFGRVYRPVAFIRMVRAISGTPRVRIRMRPTGAWGEATVAVTSGSNHLRYVGGEMTLRLTTDAPVGHIASERLFRLEEPVSMFLGPDEGLDADIAATAERMLHETLAYWRGWVRTLSVPLEWQEAVIRAAITLKLCAHEETGAIVAALTTSIPAAPAPAPALASAAATSSGSVASSSGPSSVACSSGSWSTTSPARLPQASSSASSGSSISPSAMRLRSRSTVAVPRWTTPSSIWTI